LSPEKAQFSTLGKFSRGDVRYLALEGGGGKGFAYIGAIQALETLGILRTEKGRGQPRPTAPSYLEDIDPTGRLRPESIRGVAGSSAGAITALLLSCGYNADDILHIMTAFDFNGLFEPPVPRYVPRIQVNLDSDDALAVVEKPADVTDSIQQISSTLRQAVTNRSASWESLLNNNLDKLASLSDPFLAKFGLAPVRPGPQKLDTDEFFDFLDAAMSHLTHQQQDQVRSVVAETSIAAVIRQLLLLPYASQDPKNTPKAIQMLGEFPTPYTAFLSEDLGLFAGYEARRLFAEILAYKLPLRNGKPWYNATFQDHYEHFGVALAVTGTNFETKKGGVFSWRTTPNFPVADAVRLSMSMPIIYKPFIIRAEDYPEGYLPSWVNGVWVDGGYLNNIPLHSFDREEGANPKTLGLRLSLTDEQPVRIENIMDFLVRWGNFGVWGTGEAHINEASMNVPQTILLDTTGLSTLDFAPDPAERDRAIERARQDTLHYFEE